MGWLLIFIVFLVSAYIAIKASFKLTGIALGSEGFGGIVAFWIGAVIVALVGMGLGVW